MRVLAVEVRRDLAPVLDLRIKDFFTKFVGKFFGDPVQTTSPAYMRIRINFDLAIYSESRRSVTVDCLQTRTIVLAHSLMHLLLNFKA